MSRSPTSRLAFGLVAALLVAACDPTATDFARADRSDVPAVALNVSRLSVEPGDFVTVRLEVEGRGVASAGERRAELPSAAQGEIRWQAGSARLAGQVPLYGHAVVVDESASVDGRVPFVSIRPGASGKELATFVFEVTGPDFIESLEFDLSHALTESGDDLLFVPLDGVRSDQRLPNPANAQTLEWFEWVDFLPSGTGIDVGPEGPLRVPGAADIFGDGTQDGIVNVLDVLYVAVLSVVNRSLGECILGSDSPGRDCVAVNVFPTNLPGLGEATDDCPPGTEAPCSADRRLINVLDVLLIANESVGTDQPVVGEVIPKSMPLPGFAQRTGTILGADTLVADSVYQLVGRVTVGSDAASAELVIEAGTRIVGSAGSALVISRNGRIVADGTRIRPIVFSCDGVPSPGCWDGLVVNGNGSTHPGPSTNPVLTGRTAAGCAEQDGGVLGFYGGCSPSDSSGVLRFVHVEYAGAGGRALDLRAVGSGTAIEHLYVHRSQFAGLHVEGGEALIRNVRSTGNQSIGLSWSGGWTGALQYAAIQAESTALNAIDGQNSSTSPAASPRSAPHLRNVTVIGPPIQGVAFGAGSVRVRDGSDARMESFLFVGQPTPAAYVLDIDGAESWARFEAGGIALENSVIVGYGRLGDLDADTPGATGFFSPDVEGQYLRDASNGNAIIVDFGEVDGALFGPWSTVPDLRIEPAGAVGSLTCAALASDPFFDPVTFCGALEVAGTTVIPWMEPGPRFDASATLSDPQPGYLEYQVVSPELGVMPGVTVMGPTPGVTGLDGWYRSYTSPAPFIVTLSGLPAGCIQPPGTTTLNVPGPLELATPETQSNLGIVVDCSGVLP